MKRAMRLAGAVIVAGIATGTPTVASGQCAVSGAPATCTQAGSVSMTAGRVVRLQASAASTTLNTPTPADFDAGFNATTGPTFTVSANTAWTLSLRAGSSLWTAVNTSPGAPARTNKPAGDLTWSTVPGGTFVALSTTDASLFTGTATASNTTTVYFRTAYDWTLDTPGNYSLAVVLTLTAP